VRLLLYIFVLVALAFAVGKAVYSAHELPDAAKAALTSPESAASRVRDGSNARQGLIVVEQIMLTTHGQTKDAMRKLPHYWVSEPAYSQDESHVPNPLNGPRTTLNYVATVDLDVPTYELWAIFFPQLLHDAEISLNGNAIGPPLQSPGYSRSGLRTKYVPLPGGALNTGANVFSITLTAKPDYKAMLGKFYIGPASTLEQWHDKRVFQQQMLWFAFAVLVLIGMIAIVLGHSSESNRVYYWFAAMCLSWVIAGCCQLLTYSPIDWKWIDLLSSIGGILFTCFAYLFCLSIIRQNSTSITRVILSLSTVTAIIYTASTAFELPGALHLQLSIGILLALGVVVAWRFLRQTMRSPTDDFLILSTAGVLILGFGVLGTYMSFVGDRPSVRLLNYLTPLVMLAAGYLLLNRFSRTLKRTEDQVVTSPAVVKDLSDTSAAARHLLVAERERIMRDMHDGVGGHLVSSLSILRNHNISNPDLEETLGQALVDLRLMIDSLEETDGDLSVAVAMLKDRTQRSLKGSTTKTTWRIEEIVLPARGPADTLQILRIIQECISNVLKHANAEQLGVSARMAASDLAHFSVYDNGKGFDTDSTSAGRGIMNLHRRSEALGATLEIESSTDGTRVDLWVPNQPSSGTPSESFIS